MTPSNSYSALAPWVQEQIEKEAIERMQDKSDLVSIGKILQITQHIYESSKARFGVAAHTELVVKLVTPNGNQIITIRPSYNPLNYYCSGRGLTNPLMKDYGLSM